MKVYKSSNRKTKISAIAVCLLLTAMLVIGGTIAYLFTHTDPVVNTFNPVTPGTDIPEEMEGTVKQNATVQNTGTVDSYLRAQIIVTWQDGSGNVHAVLPTSGDYTMTNGSNWKKIGDYYYYTKVAAPGKPTTENEADCLIIKAEAIGVAPVDGYTLHVEILGQSVQSTPVDAITQTWNIDPSVFIAQVQP